jgi:hypothetical protein
MGFFDDLNCALFGCSSATDSVANVVNSFTTHMNVSCSPVVNVKQSTTCTLMNKNCSNMNLQCGNISQMNASCDLEGLVNSAVQAIQQMDNQAVTRALSLPVNSSSEDIRNAISANLTTNCSPTAIANTELLSKFLCTNSSDVTLAAMSQYDGQSACAVAAVAGMAKRGNSEASNILIIVVFAIVVLLYIAFLVFIIIKIRASGKKL